MSNKKLFWIAFFILSCCEFGQFAYSKNISAGIQATQLENTDRNCHADHALVSEFKYLGMPESYSLAR